MKPLQVQLAKEVLQLLRDEKIIAKPGEILRVVGGVIPKQGVHLKKTLKSKPCTVCVAGAILYAVVVNHKSIRSPGESISGSLNCIGVNKSTPIWKVVNNFFDVDQIKLIEYAFEGFSTTADIVFSETLRKAKAFYKDYRVSPKRRLIAIMENIIANGGRFKL